jgi:hypothetical protein
MNVVITNLDRVPRSYNLQIYEKGLTFPRTELRLKILFNNL